MHPNLSTRPVIGLPILLSLLLTSGSFDAAAEDQWPSLDLVALFEAGTLPAPRDVTIPKLELYDTPKRYSAIPLLDVLALLPGLEAARARGDELQVTALDGFQATLPWELVNTDKAWLAVRDLDAPAGTDWETFITGRQETSPGPFYVVWEGGVDSVPDHYWPYQAIEITLKPFGAAYGAAAPVSDDPPVQGGFRLFLDHCFACHSVNLVGGTVGPELNVPRNPVEYWRPDDLVPFIRNASDYHARSKMPSFSDQLTDEDIASLITYLTAMSSQKVCRSASACDASN